MTPDQEKIAALELRIAELEQRVIEQRVGYHCNILTLTDQARGKLYDVTRWLETAHDAATADTPSMSAVIERLRDSRKVINDVYEKLSSYHNKP